MDEKRHRSTAMHCAETARLSAWAPRGRGANPSLVEALGAGNAVIMHDNAYNRWVAGEGALPFAAANGVDRAFIGLLAQLETAPSLQTLSRLRHRHAFQWGQGPGQYAKLLATQLDPCRQSLPFTSADNVQEHAQRVG